MAKTTTNSFKWAREALSDRLQTLQSYYSGQSHVWDIGCDHGQLGLSFSEVKQVETIHLVDPSGPVIVQLKEKLKDSYITKANIYHQTGQSLKINFKSNCIFIAGMGGKEIGEILASLVAQLDSSSKIVISPHRKILELRRFLQTLPVSLEAEEVVCEDGQFYQILSLVPGVQGMKVSLYGDAVFTGFVGKSYLDHQLKYFSAHRDEESQAFVKYLQARKA